MQSISALVLLLLAMFRSSRFVLLSVCAVLLMPGLPAHAQQMPTSAQIAYVKRCITEPGTTLELDALSRAAAKATQLQHTPVDVPLSVKLIASRLVQASPTLSRKSAGLVEGLLQGYESSQVSAQLRGTAGILVSSALWRATPPLSAQEQAAVLAHELAHLEKDDLQLWGCFAQSRGLPEVPPFPEALDSALQEKDPLVGQFLHEMELAADRRARELLHDAGFDPLALDQVLSRKDLQSPEPSFTHPGSRARVLSAPSAL